MASGVIEQLLDFNQGNLYPKIANVNASYVSENDTNGAAGFIKDLFAGEAFDASIFGLSGNKLSLKSGAVIPGTIDNAATADKVKNTLNIKTAQNETTTYDGSVVINIAKVYQADKATSLTNEFKIRIPDDSAGRSTYKTVGESVTIDKVYSAVKADSADETKGSLKITYTDSAGDSQTLVDDWKGGTPVTANITGISEAKYARNLKNGSNIITGNAQQLSSILTVSSTGAIATLDPSIGPTATVILSIKNNEGVYSYQWIDGTTVGGAGGAQVDQAALNTAYYVLGASASGQTTIYGNFRDHSPYFKGLNLYQTSDETLKTFTEDLDVNLDNLASIKKGLFYWNSDENKVLDIGVTAQSLEPLFPELVTETDGIKAVSYSKLSVVALAAIDKLYKRVKELEYEVEKLKSK